MLCAASAIAPLIRQFEDGCVKNRGRPGHASRDARPCARGPPRTLVFAGIGDRRIAVGLPAAFEPAAAIEPVTGERRGWRPAPARCRRAAKPRQVVIGIGCVGKAGLAQPGRDALRLHRPEFYESGFCESFEHRSPPLPRLARQAGERGSQLGATITSHAAKAGAIDPDIPRQRRPDHDRRGGVAKGGTAHVLFIRVERIVANDVLDSSAGMPDLYRCQALFLSSWEDRCYPGGRI